jgi:hypothetical protein
MGDKVKEGTLHEDPEWTVTIHGLLSELKWRLTTTMSRLHF